MGNLTLNGSTSGQITISPPAVAGTNTLSLPAATGTVLTSSGDQTITGTMVMGSSFLRNRIINGAMVIDQRNAGASSSVGTATATYTLDRWRVYHDTAITSNITAQQSSTVPTQGYSNSQILTNGTAASAAAGDLNVIQQRIEGYNVFDFNYGSSTAATTTLSFWVRSSLTGTFGFGVTNSNQDRSIVYTYTINSANTWEQKTITIAGDQSGTWLTTNGIGLILSWDLGSGTSSNAAATGTWYGARYVRTSACTNFIGTTGATFYITGVQLEVGTVATPFERRQYGQELMLCQRYYTKSYDVTTVPGTQVFAGEFLMQTFTNNNVYCPVRYPVPMRTDPTLTFYPGYGAGASPTAGNFWNYTTSANVASAVGRTGTTGYSIEKNTGSASATIGWQYTASAEL